MSSELRGGVARVPRRVSCITQLHSSYLLGSVAQVICVYCPPVVSALEPSPYIRTFVWSHLGPKSSFCWLSHQGTHLGLGLRACGCGVVSGGSGRRVPRPARFDLPSGFPLHSQGQAFEKRVQFCGLLQLRHRTTGLSLSLQTFVLGTHEGVQQAPGTWSLVGGGT